MLTKKVNRVNIKVSFTTHLNESEVKPMNKNLLFYEMKELNLSIKAICKKLGISRSAFYRKCNGITEFTLREIQIMLELGLPSRIFFGS